MSPSFRRLTPLAGAAAIALGVLTATAPAAQAGAFRIVYDHYYTDANALSECQTTGQAAVDAGRWDFYRCIQHTNPTQVELQGWINIL